MRRILVWCLVIVAASSTAATAAEYVVKAGAPNKVVFISKAATETFEGKTNRIQGRISVDPAAVGDSVVVYLEVEMASLDTGIGKRNQHMRENHLETAKYPKSIFDGASVIAPAGAVLATGKPVDFTVEGTFTLHGVTKRLRTIVRVTANADGTLAFETSFKVPLADYGIGRPRFLFLKLGEVQDVKVSGVASPKP